MLELVYTRSKAVCVVIGQYRTNCLKNGRTMVVLLIHHMNGDPALSLTCCNNRFMHKPAIHTLATVFGQ